MVPGLISSSLIISFNFFLVYARQLFFEHHFEHHFEPKAYYIIFMLIYLKIIEMRLYHAFVGVCLFLLVR